jgi:hypothetical protein
MSLSNRTNPRGDTFFCPSPLLDGFKNLKELLDGNSLRVLVDPAAFDEVPHPVCQSPCNVARISGAQRSETLLHIEKYFCCALHFRVRLNACD